MSYERQGWGGDFETEPQDTEKELSEDLLTFKEQWEAACTDFPELFTKVINKLDKIKDESKQRTEINELDKKLVETNLDEETLKTALNIFLKGDRAAAAKEDQEGEDDEDDDEEEETIH